MSVVDELRDSGLVLSVVDVPPPGHRNEDGSPTVIAHEEDSLFEVLEWATMNRLRVIRDSAEQADCVLAVLTPDWQKSVLITKEIMGARRAKRPLFLLTYPSMRLMRA